MEYVTPPEFRLDLHFPRSRFNSELEDTLLLLASKMAEIGSAPKEGFDGIIDEFLSNLYGGKKEDKTIANQRTEMIRLYGLAKYQNEEFVKDGKLAKRKNVIVGNRTLLLVQNQDLSRFFKSVCNKFQYPNYINKTQFVQEYVQAGVRFKPAQYLIKLLRAGSRKTGKTFAVTAKEVAHLVFNDTRVTVNQENPEKRVELFIELRNKDILCDGTGDVIRYARDFLKFMVMGNLMISHEGRYFLNEGEKAALNFIESDNGFFEDFDLAKQGVVVEKDEIKEVEEDWLSYYADADFAEEEKLNTPITSYEKTTVEITTDNNQTEIITTGYDLPADVIGVITKPPEKVGGQTTKAIGDEGEAIVYSLEKERVTKERPDLLGLVRIVSNDTSLGFDVQSIFATGVKKYIEVKTTKRNFVPDDYNIFSYFNISFNEWTTAQQHGDNYFIARVIIAKEKYSVFVIQNPFKRHEEGKISLYPIEYRLLYTEEAGEFSVKDKILVQ
jgi:hypothetical protein